jgi:fatty acyl-CoA reductase
MASKLNSVQEFYKGKSIFITGGSGFMGKVLIEKLLYSCSELKEIIILMRPKRGKTANQRVEEFSKLPVSEIIKIYLQDN